MLNTIITDPIIPWSNKSAALIRAWQVCEPIKVLERVPVLEPLSKSASREDIRSHIQAWLNGARERN
jgi:hypothetical protein